MSENENPEGIANGRHVQPNKHPYKYKCPFCGKKYTSRSGLLSHKNTVHFQRKPYRCEKCNQHFSTSTARVAHIKRCNVAKKAAALKDKVTQEPDTKEASETSSVPEPQLEPRRIPRQKPKPFPKRPFVPEPLSCHKHPYVSSHPRQDRSFYKCLECLCQFETSDQLVAHVRIGHPVKPLDVEPYLLECYVCSGLKLPEDEMTAHIRKKHLAPILGNESEPEAPPKTVKKFKCKHCDKVLDCLKRLKIHTKFQHSEDYKKIDSNSGGEARLKTVQKCKMCLQDIASNHQNLLHRSLYCRVDFSCQICFKRFNSVSDFLSHARQSQTSGCLSVEEDRGYKGKTRTDHHLMCPFCGTRFRSQKGYMRHVSELHRLEVAEYCCSQCSKRTGDMNEAVKHAKSHPGGTQCDITFVQETESKRLRKLADNFLS